MSFKRISSISILFLILVSPKLYGQSAVPVLENVEAWNRAAKLSWNYDEPQHPLFFRIYRKTLLNSAYKMVQQVPGGDRAKLDYWLENDSTYYYRITAVDIYGNESDSSNVKSIQPQPNDPQIFWMSPNRGSNDTILFIENISGNNFIPADQIKLKKSEDTLEIYSENNLNITPDHISCFFNLIGKPTGNYDLILERENLDKAVLERGFSIYPSRFIEVSSEVGLVPNKYQSFGCVWGDINLDGLLDLFVVNQDTSNQLFINSCTAEKDTFKIFDFKEEDRVNGNSAVVWIDYDNDGDLDIFNGVLKFQNCLLANQIIPEQKLEFNSIGDQVRLFDDTFEGSRSASWADFNLDGQLDLYFINYYDTKTENYIYTQKNGIFEKKRAIEIGAEVSGDDGYSANWADYDNDGNLDLYVSNGDSNRLFKNLGDGTFKDVTKQTGVGFEYHTENSAWGDYNNDGYLDLYIVNTNNKENILYTNKRDGTFLNITPAPLNDDGFGFAAAWGDYDNDGDLDLFLARGGYREDNLGTKRGQVSRMFENLGNESFQDIADEMGLADSLVATGAIWGDYNNDGYLDLFVTVRDIRSALRCNNRLYKNPGGSNNYIKILLEGTISNRAGIGARIELINDNYLQIREISGGEGRSHVGVMAHFGLGLSQQIQKIKVKWPSGIKQFLNNIISINDYLKIKEPHLPKIDTLIATPSINQIILNWPDKRDGTDIKYYCIYRSIATVFDESTTDVIAEQHQDTLLIDSNVENYVAYSYWVRGIDNNKNFGQLSESVTAKAISSMPNLHPPDTLIAIPGVRRITLLWPDNRSQTDIISYDIFRDTVEVFNETTALLIIETYSDTCFIDSTVIFGIPYSYWVRGVDSKNNRGELSMAAKATAKPDLHPPDSLFANPDNGRVILRWEDNRKFTDILAFNVYRDTTNIYNEYKSNLIAEGFLMTEYVDSTVVNGTAYTYWLRGFLSPTMIGPVSPGVTLIPHQLSDFAEPYNIIDEKDLAAFRIAYLNSLEGIINSEYDIGPAIGEVPGLIPQKDNKIDFEDLVVFIQVWRWYVQFGQSQNLVSSTPCVSQDAALIQIEENYVNHQTRTAEFSLNLKLKFPVEAAEFKINYNPEGVTIGNILPGNIFTIAGVEPILMQYNQTAKGNLDIMLCPAVSSEKFLSSSFLANGKLTLLQLQLKYKEKLPSKMTVAYQLLNAFDKTEITEKADFSLVSIPDKFRLCQNYPNPFNFVTLIPFDLPKRSSVKLVLHNTLGEKLKVIHIGECNAGHYEVKLEANDLASGIYFYKLETESFSDIKKLIILK